MKSNMVGTLVILVAFMLVLQGCDIDMSQIIDKICEFLDGKIPIELPFCTP